MCCSRDDGENSYGAYAFGEVFKYRYKVKSISDKIVGDLIFFHV